VNIRDSSALVLTLALSGLSVAAQPQEHASPRGGRYTLVVEGYDWGAGVSKVVLAILLLRSKRLDQR
jgi:hypothetical protein